VDIGVVLILSIIVGCFLIVKWIGLISKWIVLVVGIESSGEHVSWVVVGIRWSVVFGLVFKCKLSGCLKHCYGLYYTNIKGISLNQQY